MKQYSLNGRVFEKYVVTKERYRCFIDGSIMELDEDELLALGATLVDCDSEEKHPTEKCKKHGYIDCLCNERQSSPKQSNEIEIPHMSIVGKTEHEAILILWSQIELIINKFNGKQNVYSSNEIEIPEIQSDKHGLIYASAAIKKWVEQVTNKLNGR